MKIILRVYKDMRMGNLSSMIIDIPHNKITVRELKDKIFKKYKINPDEQKLTFRLCHKKLIILTDSFPLNYFLIGFGQIPVKILFYFSLVFYTFFGIVSILKNCFFQHS